MSRQTFVRVEMPGGGAAGGAIDEVWTVLTHELGDEWWSEILDGHRHPQVDHDAYGFDTVRKYFGDTLEGSRAAALRDLDALVRGRGGRVGSIGEPEER